MVVVALIAGVQWLSSVELGVSLQYSCRFIATERGVPRGWVDNRRFVGGVKMASVDGTKEPFVGDTRT
jgi:hypothetical protein